MSSALKPSHCWWHADEDVGLAGGGGRGGRLGRDRSSRVRGSRSCGPFGMGTPKCGGPWRWSPAPTDQTKAQRAIVVTTDPLQLPAVTTWYLLTNLPAPGSARAATSRLAPASLAEIVRLYGLRMWVEQSYKQVKHALGWAEYQVRSDVAMRRHWVLVWCAFSFCWWQLGHGAAEAPAWLDAPGGSAASGWASQRLSGAGKKTRRARAAAPAGVLAGRVAAGAGVVGAVDHAQAVLARVVAAAPTTGAPGAARLGAAAASRSISMNRSDRSQQSTVSFCHLAQTAPAAYDAR